MTGLKRRIIHGTPAVTLAVLAGASLQRQEHGAALLGLLLAFGWLALTDGRDW